MSIAACASTFLAVDSRNKKKSTRAPPSRRNADCNWGDDNPENKLEFAISAGKLGIGQSSILPRLFPFTYVEGSVLYMYSLFYSRE
jgi:hypothetical protein